MECVDKILPACGIVLRLVSLVLCLCHILACLSDIGIKHICHLMELGLVHKSLVFKHSLFRLCHNILGNLSHRHYAVVILLNIIEAGTDNTVEHVGKQEAFLCNRVAVLLLCKRIEGLRLEAYASHSQTQTQPVHSQLLCCVVIKKLCRHGGLYRTA